MRELFETIDSNYIINFLKKKSASKQNVSLKNKTSPTNNYTYTWMYKVEILTSPYFSQPNTYIYNKYSFMDYTLQKN